MPKLRTLAVPASIFLLLTAAAQPASAANWVELGKDSEEQTWSMDSDSVQTKGSIVSAWVKTEYPNKIGSNGPNGTIRYLDLGSPYDYSQCLLEFDFSDRTYREVAMYDYDRSGKQARSITTPSRWEHIAPDTIAENIYSTLKRWLNR